MIEVAPWPPGRPLGSFDHQRILGDLGAGSVRATAVEVDLSLVSFIDSTGIGKLVGARAHARSNNSDLWIVNPSPGVRRVLNLLGLMEILSAPDSTGTAA